MVQDGRPSGPGRPGPPQPPRSPSDRRSWGGGVGMPAPARDHFRPGRHTGGVDRKRVFARATRAGRRPGGEASGALTARRTEEVRTRVRLMIEITARSGSYRNGLLAAARHLSPEEAAIIADLERHGLQVPQLRDVLCGGHVLVDDPQLYEDWRF